MVLCSACLSPVPPAAVGRAVGLCSHCAVYARCLRCGLFRSARRPSCARCGSFSFCVPGARRAMAAARYFRPVELF